MSLLPEAYASVDTPYYAPFGTTTGITTNLQVSTLAVNQAGNLFLTSDPLKPGIAAGIYFQSLGGTQAATWEQMNQNTRFGGTTSNQVSILNQAKTAYGDFAVGNFSIYGSGAVNGLPIAEFTERGISGQLEIRSPQINMSTLLVPELLSVSTINGTPWNNIGSSTFSTIFISSATVNQASISSLTVSSINGQTPGGGGGGSLISTFSTIFISSATMREASISSLRVSSLSDYSPTGASFSTTSISSIVSVNLSSLVSNVSLSLISTMQFQPNISGSLGGVNLGMGNFLGGIVGGLGSGVFNTALAGAALATGIVAMTNTRTTGFAPGTTNNYQLVNTQTQLQFSTLGAATSGFFRFVNSATPQTPGLEFISSFTIPAGTIAIRSMSDPLNLANSTIVTSTIQSFGSWVPLPQPAQVPTDNILALTVSSINTIGWDQMQYQNQTPVPNPAVRSYTVVAGVNDVFCVSATSSSGGGLFQSRAAILTPGTYLATAFCAMVRSRIINLDTLYPNAGGIMLFQNLFVQPLPTDSRYISFINTNTGISPPDTSYTYSWNATYATNYPPATGPQMTQSAALFGADPSVIGYGLAPGLAVFVPLPFIGGTPTNTPLPFGPNIQVSTFIASTMTTSDRLLVYKPTVNASLSSRLLFTGLAINYGGSTGPNTIATSVTGQELINNTIQYKGGFYDSQDITRFRLTNVSTFSDITSAPMEIGNTSTIFGSNIGIAANNGYIKFDAPVYFNSLQPVSMSTLTVSTINSFNWSTISLCNQADAIVNAAVTVQVGVNNFLCVTASLGGTINSYDIFTLTPGVYATLDAFVAMVNPLFQFFPEYDSLALITDPLNPDKLTAQNGNGSSPIGTSYTLHFNPADASLPWPGVITEAQITANAVLMGGGTTNIVVADGATEYFPDYPGTPVIGKVPFGADLQLSTLTVSGFVDTAELGTQKLIVSDTAEGPNPTEPQQFATKQYVDTQILTQVGLTGQIILYASPVCPPGYLVCDGESYANTAYPALYEVIKNFYGGGGGFFNVPDLQTRVPRGTMANNPINCSVTFNANNLAAQLFVEVTPPVGSVSGNWQIADGMYIQVPSLTRNYTVEQVAWTNPIYTAGVLVKIQYICYVLPLTSPPPTPGPVPATASYQQSTTGVQPTGANSVGFTTSPYKNTLSQTQIPTHTHGYTVFKGGAGAYNANGGPEPLGQPNVPAFGATTTDGLDSTANPNGLAQDVTGQFPGTGLSTIVVNLTADPYTVVNYIIKT